MKRPLWLWLWWIAIGLAFGFEFDWWLYDLWFFRGLP